MNGKLSAAPLLLLLLMVGTRLVIGYQPVRDATYGIRAEQPTTETAQIRWFADGQGSAETPGAARANDGASEASEVGGASVAEIEPSQDPPVLAPPTKLRIERLREVCGDGVDNDRDGDVDEGCVAVPPATGGVHAYFDTLSARPDLFAAYSMRDIAQVNSLSGGTHGDYAYLYPSDPYPKKQDAMRIRIRQGEASPDGKVIVDVGPSNGASMLFVYDFWMSADFDMRFSQLQGHKNDSPLSFVVEGAPGGTWFGTQITYRNARQHEHNQPAGGPFVAMIYPHLNFAGITKTPAWWRDSMKGYPRARLPYNASSKEQRSYAEAIQPFDTSAGPAGSEFGLVAERWTRIWHYFERVPAEDWMSDDSKWLGQTMNAYRWTMWFADTEREPVRMMDGAIVGVPNSLKRDHFMRAHMGFGSGNANQSAKEVVRGDLTAYSRNWVVLHGTPKASVLTLLQKPAK